jgi:uncharacterized protein YjcR
MAKKEAHAQALKMFLDSKGKIPLKAIAEAVGVSSFSVGRWHKTENWRGKVEPIKGKRRKVEGVVIRKKDVFNQAVKIFNESGGNISNVKLGKQLRVSTMTIAKWKKMPEWSQAAQVKAGPEPSEAHPPAQIVPPPEVAPPPQTTAVDLESVTSLQDLLTLNERLGSMLERDFLTASEIEHLSNAKLSLLEAAEVYLGIVKDKGE